MSGSGSTDRPLAGRRVLVTRARVQAGALAARIVACGGEVFAFPVITIADPGDWAPLDEAIAHLERYRWLVITSPNGAEKFMSRVIATAVGVGEAGLRGVKVAAVGTATAKALARLGVAVDLVPTEHRGAALAEALAPHLAPGDRVLMARGDLADPAPADALRANGTVVDDLIAYRTLKDAGDVHELKAALQQGAIDYVAFTSSSTVHGLLDRLGDKVWLDSVRIAVIGPETKKAALAAGLSVHCVAAQATIDGLVDAIITDCQRLS